MNRAKFFLSLSLGLAALAPLRAEVKPNSLFASGAVLQRDVALPVFGSARDGEKITVKFAGQEVSTTAKGGSWLLRLKPMPANAEPQSMTISGENSVILNNLLVGDVWVASGQSNMERQLGPRPGQKDLLNWKEEASRADFPQIRQYTVPEHFSFQKEEDARGSWSVCSPETAKDFCAVGYYFARDLHKAVKVPIGILFSAWGGTAAEVWTSPESLSQMADFKQAVEAAKATSLEKENKKYEEKLDLWYLANDPGAAGAWSARDFFDSKWKQVTVPYKFDDDFDGIIWFRRDFTLPPLKSGASATLSLGAIDDADTTWINGVKVGGLQQWDAIRNYQIPAGLLKKGKNSIAIRVLDTGWGGGFAGPAERLRLDITGSSQVSIALGGQWRAFQGVTLTALGKLPENTVGGFPGIVTVLHNSMIFPLLRFPIKGAIWYQGEANAGNSRQYRELFPLLIADWRKGWDLGDFPFLFVQIAPYNYLPPEIREAQLLTLAKAPNTAMAVTADVGDAKDIHPANKAPVGGRLALAARALAYGEKLEYSGPIYSAMKIEGDKASLSFTHLGGGLLAKGGDLKGFAVAGADKNFVPAHAVIKGGNVQVWSDQVKSPVAVRYGWANAPEVNLFNKAGLPASPFRTDGDQ